jgi:type IV secretory pathway VirB6-like protein
MERFNSKLLLSQPPFILSPVQTFFILPQPSKMADDSESTPFLTNNGHDQDTAPVQHPEDDVVKATFPVNAYFKRPVKIVTICVSLFSGVSMMILIAAFAILQVAPFTAFYYGADYAIKALGITVSITISPYFAH